MNTTIVHKLIIQSSAIRNYCLENRIDIKQVISAINSAESRLALLSEPERKRAKAASLKRNGQYTIRCSQAETWTTTSGEKAEIALRFSAFDDALAKIEDVHGVLAPTCGMYADWLVKFVKVDANESSPNAKPASKRNGKPIKA